MMKTAITATLLTLAITMSGTAFAETAKTKKITVPKVDMITTQSITTGGEAQNCGKPFSNLKTMKACGNANSYPVNALSGMNLN